MGEKASAKSAKLCCFLILGSFALAVVAFLPPTAAPAQNPKNELHDASFFLRPSLATGQIISQVFSRAISLKGDGIDPLVRRVSGTATYRVTGIGDHEYSFDAKFLYDGRPDASGTSKIQKGGRESCWEGQCSNATDASGLLFNPLIWGTQPSTIAVGTKWHTQIAIPWELGPQGDEDVTVVGLDAATGTITLLRQGSGDGPFDHDASQIKITSKGTEYSVDVKPGHASWSGYTIFSKGLVVSDELLVERSLTLSSKELGNIDAFQRQYILLNKMPQPSSWN
jgi:hypothetical protein